MYKMKPSKSGSRIRDLLFPIMLKMTKTKVKYELILCNEMTLSTEKPVIFAVNHSAFADTPIALKVSGRRSYILAGKQNLALEDRIFFEIIGAIWVDRKNKAELRRSKDILVNYLKRGQSILWFPEGTWNLTDNLLMLPMKWGIIDVAQRAHAQIQPIVLEYDRAAEKCYVKFGKCIDADCYDKKMAINMLRDTMATLRYEFWEQNGIYRRKDLDLKKCREETLEAVREYPPLQWEYEQSCIWKPESKK